MVVDACAELVVTVVVDIIAEELEVGVNVTVEIVEFVTLGMLECGSYLTH